MLLELGCLGMEFLMGGVFETFGAAPATVARVSRTVTAGAGATVTLARLNPSSHPQLRNPLTYLRPTGSLHTV